MAHNDICTYHIRLRGRVEEDEINALGPLRVIVEAPPLPSPDAAADANAAATQFTVRSDQAGVVGLLRHLHGLGYIFLSVCRTGAD